MKKRWLIVPGLLVLVGIVLLWQHLGGASTTAALDGAVPNRDTVVCYGRVDVASGVAGLSVVQPGRVIAVCVVENADVEAGAILLRVDNGTFKLRLRAAEIALRSACEQLEQARTQVQRHGKLVAQQQGAIKAARHRRVIGELAQKRKRELVSQKLIDPIELAIAEEETRALHALEAVEVARLAELELQNPNRGVKHAELELEAANNREAQARQMLAECDVKAPAAGTVLRILAAPGDLVGTPAKPVAVWFVPRQPYLVRAEVDQEFASQLAVGLPALIAEEGSEATTWKGRVLRIARWVYPRRSIVTDPFFINDTRTVECLVSIDRAHPPLRIGQRMRVQINPPGR